MALILSLETSTSVCSVALAKNGVNLEYRESFEDKSHATVLTLFIEEVLKSQNFKVQELDAIAISQGPGSYTGLRIGVSVAKGLCYAQNVPLIAIDTLASMVIMAKEESKESNLLFCPMIDARRMEVYSELFDSEMNIVREVVAEIIDETVYNDILNNRRIAFIGNGAEKCKGTIQSSKAVFIDNIYPSAKYMSLLAQKAFDNNLFEDVAYFEPFYLKDFVATTPKRKVI